MVGFVLVVSVHGGRGYLSHVYLRIPSCSISAFASPRFILTSPGESHFFFVHFATRVTMGESIGIVAGTNSEHNHCGHFVAVAKMVKFAAGNGSPSVITGSPLVSATVYTTPR